MTSKISPLFLFRIVSPYSCIRSCRYLMSQKETCLSTLIFYKSPQCAFLCAWKCPNVDPHVKPQAVHNMLLHWSVTSTFHSFYIFSGFSKYLHSRLYLLICENYLIYRKKCTVSCNLELLFATVPDSRINSWAMVLGTLFDPCRLAYLAYTSNDWASPP